MPGHGDVIDISSISKLRIILTLFFLQIIHATSHRPLTFGPRLIRTKQVFTVHRRKVDTFDLQENGNNQQESETSQQFTGAKQNDRVDF